MKTDTPTENKMNLTYAAGDTVTLKGDRRERPIKPSRLAVNVVVV